MKEDVITLYYFPRIYVFYKYELNLRVSIDVLSEPLCVMYRVIRQLRKHLLFTLMCYPINCTEYQRWQVSQTKPNWPCKIEQIYLNKWSICQKPFAQNTNWPRSQLNKTLLEQIPIPQILITQFFHSTDLNWPESVLNIVDWTWFCLIDHSTILWRMISIIVPSHNESKP